MNKHISLATAIILTGWSERTFRRKFADGTIERNMAGNDQNSKSLIDITILAPHILFPLNEEDIQLVLDADKGIPQSQAELAILYLENLKYKEAVYWLDVAAKQGDSNAMQLLGRAYIDGQGVAKDENIGMMWIAKAASQGDVIATEYMGSVIQSFQQSNS